MRDPSTFGPAPVVREEAHPASGRRGPRTLLRKVAGPLVAYHALILIGAFLVIAGGGWGPWRAVGAGLVGVGIALEVAILAWTAALTRSAAAEPTTMGRSLAHPSRGGARRVCVACGREGVEGIATCPQCGKAVVSLGPFE